MPYFTTNPALDSILLRKCFCKTDLWSLKAALNNLSAFTIPSQNDLTKPEPENDDFDPFGSVNATSNVSNPVASKSNNDLIDDFFGSNSTPETVVPDPEIKGWFL